MPAPEQTSVLSRRRMRILWALMLNRTANFSEPRWKLPPVGRIGIHAPTRRIHTPKHVLQLLGALALSLFAGCATSEKTATPTPLPVNIVWPKPPDPPRI